MRPETIDATTRTHRDGDRGDCEEGTHRDDDVDVFHL